MAHPVLWQFRASHYNEKARWALDWKRVPHVRRSLLPGLHIPRVLLMTGRKQVPVLVLDGRTITDSAAIIAALEAVCPDSPLYPSDAGERRRALDLEAFLDDELGPHVRRALFHDLLPVTDYAADFLSTGSSATARSLYRLAFPAIRVAMRFDMGIDERRNARSREKVLAALDRLEAELGGGDYLVGDRFTVADLTAAALLAPLVRPPEFPYALLAEPFPEPAASYQRSFAGRRAFQWVLDTYRRHRGRSAAVADE